MIREIKLEMLKCFHYMLRCIVNNVNVMLLIDRLTTCSPECDDANCHRLFTCFCWSFQGKLYLISLEG